MILAVTATQMELDPFLAEITAEKRSVDVLLSGVGPVESAVRLAAYLHTCRNVRLVVNFGVGGAYVQPTTQGQPEILDLCLATSETLGDLGIDMGHTLAYLDERWTGPLLFALDEDTVQRTVALFDAQAMACHVGPFVTVSAASGSAERGSFLRERWQGICENMEGAGLARVCREFHLPMLEVRAISNLVEDRDPAQWRLVEASAKAGQAAALIIKELLNDR